ncbi:MAG: hypothetical protein IKW96_12405 [Ruminococcus sp.]|uniref:hypothetical protein n=1 Tax=Ruminococcus sp. TaxID=41978 RepID=UPI0025CDA24D|nr:hypothetical protein [Ruminococcus sp.]MBR5684057.1 hypothetical protein [Ruminococcus sp.]
MKNVIKKTIGAVLSAVTLSACVVVPASFNQTSGSSSFVNSIVANAVNTNYTRKITTGTVTVKLARIYIYKNGKFISYEEDTGISANVAKDTPVEILGEKDKYYLISYANDGLWMKKSEIKLDTKIIAYEVTQDITYTVSSIFGSYNIIIKKGDVLELDPKGTCVRYYGNSGYLYINNNTKISPVGSNFHNYIGYGLKKIN